MGYIVSNYVESRDYERVNSFLRETFNPEGPFTNWEQVRWEYGYYHSYHDKGSLHLNGIWEEDGRIVAMVNYESKPGEAFFQFRPGYEGLFPEMLDYAEANIGISRDGGKRYLKIFVPDWDDAMIALAASRGYEREGTWSDYYSRLDIPNPFPEILLPEGFRVQGLDADNDLAKTHACLWKGFDHGDDVPEEYEGRKRMQQAPNWKPELNIVVVAPDGSFVAYAGHWYDPALNCSFVEPVATVPAYRRMGLGKAAVMEGVRRCAGLGAAMAFVGSDQPFYKAMGFKPISSRSPWFKVW